MSLTNDDKNWIKDAVGEAVISSEERVIKRVDERINDRISQAEIKLINHMDERMNDRISQAEIKLINHIDEKIEDRFYNHPMINKIYDMLDKALGSLLKDKEEIDLLSERVTGLEEKNNS
ncbi:hypothetical protein COV24_03665 [candidate division WWE3 bacterium CG10_big_fil_rev_8_21_14_0_10_32_10]|uniref:Uncharacterized protein n=1 Tax=candidate division WWE3 bacterium CG10_big_fil_rev_8_21_14_0_10_32_10 TaxID=1975090 RepID=A0A2H0R9Q4_UNCKA|nr:MAG: hypothetical protein COV24_03665 [candidate division WWE3 bacterium CG10_big_fil_rev_8_21_14_0_10_32_10]